MMALRQMVLANLRMTVRNRTALFWNIAFPALFIVLFGYLIGSSSISFDVGIVGADTGPAAQQVITSMQQSEAFKIKTGDQASELKALKKGDRAVVIVFTPGPNGQTNANVYWDQKNVQQGQVALNAVQQFLSETNANLAGGTPPIAINTQAITSTSLDYIDFLVPGILAMSIMNSGMIGLASAFVTYRERGILRRIKATPFPLSQFIGARILSQLVIAVAQACILILLAKLLFGLSITGNLASVLLMVILGSLAFLSLGFVVAAFARNQETADSLANAISFPMLFLSGVFFPVDSAPAILRPVMAVMPLRYLADGLRSLMVQGDSLPHVWLSIVVMLGTAAIGFALANRFFRWDANAV
jgi:ABC-2 type transport system permease protein